ncbi:hypothetical protein CYMTET_51198 [Cymbomonas tetramitiformis]|uniref:Uncharacterized protein n=1 Tax=Cymbomonas tetramitiformis TaxID=36881 RepID=A0AAE0BMS1_9CHLO|nr:hypothetical protein CYMTET_51198 [Cymbomonas tetramitiformis]
MQTSHRDGRSTHECTSIFVDDGDTGEDEDLGLEEATARTHPEAEQPSLAGIQVVGKFHFSALWSCGGRNIPSPVHRARDCCTSPVAPTLTLAALWDDSVTVQLQGARDHLRPGTTTIVCLVNRQGTVSTELWPVDLVGPSTSMRRGHSEDLLIGRWWWWSTFLPLRPAGRALLQLRRLVELAEAELGRPCWFFPASLVEIASCRVGCSRILPRLCAGVSVGLTGLILCCCFCWASRAGIQQRSNKLAKLALEALGSTAPTVTAAHWEKGRRERRHTLVVCYGGWHLVQRLLAQVAEVLGAPLRGLFHPSFLLTPKMCSKKHRGANAENARALLGEVDGEVPSAASRCKRGERARTLGGGGWRSTFCSIAVQTRRTRAHSWGRWMAKYLLQHRGANAENARALLGKVDGGHLLQHRAVNAGEKNARTLGRWMACVWEGMHVRIRVSAPAMYLPEPDPTSPAPTAQPFSSHPARSQHAAFFTPSRLPPR